MIVKSPSIVVFEEDMTMSRKEIVGANRCPVCGGKMRLVNVTWVNRFNTPEASQYDMSISRRKALFGATPVTSAQEMMCFSCSRRSPIGDVKVEKVKKAKKVKKHEQNEDTENKTNKKSKKNRIIADLIGWIIFLIVLAISAYLVYKYREVIHGYIDSFLGLIDRAKNFISRFQK